MSIAALPITVPRAPDGGDVVRVPMSREDFRNFIESAEETEYWRAEWVDGTAILMMASANYGHQKIGLRLARLLQDTLPDLFTVLDLYIEMDRSDREPDILVLADEPDDEDWHVESAALIVEISSPSTWREDLGPKADEYATAGVQYYWTVDRDSESVTLRSNTGGGWQVEGVLDESNPSIDVLISDYGTVPLRHSQIFA